MYHVPRTEETWQAIRAAADKYGLTADMKWLLQQYDFAPAHLKPVIERALAANNFGEWDYGASLAANSYYDDSFTARLVAIATDAAASVDTRGDALNALAQNRTDAGVKAIKTLLNDPDSGPEFCLRLAMAISRGYDDQLKTPTGRHLRPEDFDAKDMKPLIDRLLSSGRAVDHSYGESFAKQFREDAAASKPASPATNPVFTNTNGAIPSSELIRTNEGVNTPVGNPSGLSLEIRCANTDLKVGDEIPIEFIISNHGTNDQKYDDRSEDQDGRLYACKLDRQDGFRGECSRPVFSAHVGQMGGALDLQRASAPWRIVQQNHPIESPGAHNGAWTLRDRRHCTLYLAYPLTPKESETVASSDPISITVLPRTKEEMGNYIQGSTNQILASLTLRSDRPAGSRDGERPALVMRLMLHLQS